MTDSAPSDDQVSGSGTDSSEDMYDINYQSDDSASAGANLLTHPQDDAATQVVNGAQHPIAAPQKNDVLLGRGKPYQNFAGNRRMLKIVSQFKDQYMSMPRDQKRRFVERVLDAVLKDGTRFLRRGKENGGGDGWEEVDRTTAAGKVWHALRSKGRRKKDRTASGPGVAGKASYGEEHVTFEENMAGAAPQTQAPSPAAQSLTLADVEAVSRQILMHLSKAASAASMLASMSATQFQQSAPAAQPAPVHPPPVATTGFPTDNTFGQAAVRAANAGFPTTAFFQPPSYPLPNMQSQVSFPPSLLQFTLPTSLYQGNNGVSGGGQPGAQYPPLQLNQNTMSTAEQSQALLQALGSLTQAAQGNMRPPS